MNAHEKIVAELKHDHFFTKDIRDSLIVSIANEIPGFNAKGSVLIKDIFLLCSKYVVFTTSGALAEKLLNLSEPFQFGCKKNAATFHAANGFPTPYVSFCLPRTSAKDKSEFEDFIHDEIREKCPSMRYHMIHERETSLIQCESPGDATECFEILGSMKDAHLEHIRVDSIVQIRTTFASPMKFLAAEALLYGKGVKMTDFVKNSLTFANAIIPVLVHVGLVHDSSVENTVSITCLRRIDAVRVANFGTLRLSCGSRLDCCRGVNGVLLTDIDENKDAEDYEDTGSEENEPDSSNLLHEVISLRNEHVALYFKKMLSWRRTRPSDPVDDEASAHPTTVTSAADDVVHISARVPMSLSRGLELGSREVFPAELPTVSLRMDKRNSQFFLTISGSNSIQEFDRYVGWIKEVVGIVENFKRFDLPEWSSQQAMAISNSNLVEAEEQIWTVSAVFGYSEERACAYVDLYSGHLVEAMPEQGMPGTPAESFFEYLKILKPVTGAWTIRADNAGLLDSTFRERVRTCCAVMLEVEPLSTETAYTSAFLTVRYYGFSALIHIAKAALEMQKIHIEQDFVPKDMPLGKSLSKSTALPANLATADNMTVSPETQSQLQPLQATRSELDVHAESTASRGGLDTLTSGISMSERLALSAANENSIHSADDFFTSPAPPGLGYDGSRDDMSFFSAMASEFKPLPYDNHPFNKPPQFGQQTEGSSSGSVSANSSMFFHGLHGGGPDHASGSLRGSAFDSSMDGSIGRRRQACRGTFLFQDREAGIFFANFEAEFRLFVLKTFNVEVIAHDSTASDPLNPPFGSGARNIDGASKVSATRLELVGESGEDISRCHAFLEQLNTANLTRVQIHFPRSDPIAYRELLARKSKQGALLRGIRRQEAINVLRGISQQNMSSYDRENEDISMVPVDPLKVEGFVSIRIKPPLHSRGIKRMTFPADITITICGPTRSENQKATMRAIEEHFNNIETDYFSATIDIAVGSSIFRQLTIRAVRDEFVAKNRLIHLRFDETKDNIRITGIAGSVRVWAPTYSTLVNTLRFFESNGGLNARIVQQPHAQSAAPAVDSMSYELRQGSGIGGGLGGGEGGDRDWSYLSGITGPSAQQGVTPILGQGVVKNPSGMSASGLGSSGLGQHKIPVTNFAFNRHDGGAYSEFGAQMKEHDGISSGWSDRSNVGVSVINSLGASNALTASGGGGVNPIAGAMAASQRHDASRQMSFGRPTEKRIIRWPHHSFRFMFLSGNLKQKLNEQLMEVRQKYAINTVCPHREKNDPAACLLLQGEGHVLKAASQQMELFMRDVLSKMRCLQIVLSEPQRQMLMNMDLKMVKEIQGLCGVHIILEPLAADFAETHCAYDLRLPYLISSGMFTISAYDHISERKGSSSCSELVAVFSTNLGTQRKVIISVVSEIAGEDNRETGLTSIYILSENDARTRFDGVELKRLIEGEILSLFTGETNNLFVISKVSMFPTKEVQSEALISAIDRSLAAADARGLTNIRIEDPAGNESFSDLSADTIRALALEAVITFTQRFSLTSVERIVCVECSESKVDLDEQIVLPCAGSVMASSLLMMLQKANDPTSRDSNVQARLCLLTCNVPLNRHITAEVIYPSLNRASHRYANTLQLIAATSGGVSPIIVRGLVGGLAAALQSIQALFSSAHE
jgi:hypothetical protein